MCSFIPNAKLPDLSKLLGLILLPTAERALNKNSSALFPRRDTMQAIGSFFLIPNDLIVCLAKRWHGFCPVSCCTMVIACSSGSPDCPALIFTTTFAILRPRMGFLSTAPFAISRLTWQRYHRRFGPEWEDILGERPDVLSLRSPHSRCPLSARLRAQANDEAGLAL